MSAIISDCGKYRYRLERQLATTGITVAWFGVNPSTASAELDDPTIRKMVGFSRKLGAKRMLVGNCIPYRAANVGRIGNITEEAWLANFNHCKAMLNECAVAIPCWGAIDTKLPPHLRSAVVVTKMQIIESHSQVLCLGRTQSGHPKHPLMLGYKTPFERLR